MYGLFLWLDHSSVSLYSFWFHCVYTAEGIEFILNVECHKDIILQQQLQACVLYNGSLKIVQQSEKTKKKKPKLWSSPFAVIQNAVGIFQYDSLRLKTKHRKLSNRLCNMPTCGTLKRTQLCVGRPHVYGAFCQRAKTFSLSVTWRSWSVEQ